MRTRTGTQAEAAAEPTPEGFDSSNLPAAGNFGPVQYFSSGNIVFAVASGYETKPKNAVGAWHVQERGDTVKFIGRAFGGVCNKEYTVRIPDTARDVATLRRHRAFSYLTSDLQKLLYSDMTKTMRQIVDGRSVVHTKAAVRLDVVEVEADPKTPLIKPVKAIVDVRHDRYVNDPSIRCMFTLKDGKYTLSLLFDNFEIDVSNSIGFDDIVTLSKRKNTLDIESKARDAGPTKSQQDVRTIESAVVGKTYTSETGRATFSKRAGTLLVKVWTGHRGGDRPDAVFSASIGVDRIRFAGPRGDLGQQHMFSVDLRIALGDPLAILGSHAVFAAQPNKTVANAIEIVESALASAEPRTTAQDCKAAWRAFVQSLGARKISFKAELEDDKAVMFVKQFDTGLNVAVTGDFESGMHVNCIASILRSGHMDVVITANKGHVFVLREEYVESTARIEPTDNPSACAAKLVAFIRSTLKNLEPKINDKEQHVSFG